MLIENLSQQQPALVEEVVPKMFSYGDIQKVLVRLLRENVPIKNLATILETLADYGGITKNPDDLTEYVRQNLARVITNRFLSGEDVAIAALDSEVEQLIVEKTKRIESGSITALEPTQLHRIFKNTKELIDKFTMQGKKPIILTSPVVRPKFKKIIEQIAPNLIVLSYNEVEQSTEIKIEQVLSLT